MFFVMAFSPPPKTHDEALLSWKWVKICLLMGSIEQMLYFALLAHSLCFTYYIDFTSAYKFS